MEKFNEGDKAFVEASRNAYSAMAKFHSSTSFITDIFNVIILIAGGLFLYAKRITFGDYSTFIVSVNLFINPVNTLITFMEQFQNGVSGFSRFVEIMDEPVEEEAPDAITLEDVQGVIHFENVSYAYETSDEVLRNVDELHAQRVYIHAPSKSGIGLAVYNRLIRAAAFRVINL